MAAKAVDGHHRHPARRNLFEGRFDSRGHFLGGAIGKGDGEDAVVGLFQNMFHPLRQHPCFSGSCTGSKKDRAIVACGGRLLFFI